jgi:hypothetical protein
MSEEYTMEFTKEDDYLERNEELEEKIEKMKCCQNCIHFDFKALNYCHKGVYRERLYVCKKWAFGN